MSESTRRKLILRTLATTWVLAVGAEVLAVPSRRRRRPVIALVALVAGMAPVSLSDVIAARLRAAFPAATARMMQQ